MQSSRVCYRGSNENVSIIVQALASLAISEMCSSLSKDELDGKENCIAG